MPQPPKPLRETLRRTRQAVAWLAGARRGPLRRAALRRAVDGRTVLVTGASRGIGAAVARDCAAAGATVLLVARSADRLEELHDQIVTAGGDACVHPCDLSDLDDVDRLVKDIDAAHDHVDVLVNNAGRSIRRSVSDTVDRFHDVERVMQLNYFGAVRLTLGLLPGMIEAGGGHIVQSSTLGTFAHPPRFSAYLASKVALEEYGRVLAAELTDQGITASVVHLPLVRTAMIAPSKVYANAPAFTPEEGAAFVTRAIVTRAPAVSMGVGPLLGTIDALIPRVVRRAGNAIYRRLPS